MCSCAFFNQCSRSSCFCQPTFPRLFPCKFAALQQGIVGWISSASFILKLSVPLSPTLPAALFITCNHNNWSFLPAKQKALLSQGVFVLQLKKVARENFHQRWQSRRRSHNTLMVLTAAISRDLHYYLIARASRRNYYLFNPENRSGALCSCMMNKSSVLKGDWQR